MEGLDFLGTEPYIGHGGGHHGGGGQRWQGGNPAGWGWYNQPPIVVVESPLAEMYALLDDDAVLGDDAKVTAAQAALKAAGFTGKDGKPLKVDGIMGPNTEYAITSFWASKGTDLHMPVVDDELLKALPAPTTSAPSDGRPQKGWSQPAPEKMGPAITPDSPDPEAQKKKWYVVIIGGVAVAIGIALFAFGGKK